MAKLLEIASDAAEAVGYQRPTTVEGDDKLSRTLRVAATETARDMVRRGGRDGWSALNAVWLLDTIVGQAIYPLPPDYAALVPEATFREGLPVYFAGPIGPQINAALRAGGIAAPMAFYYRVRGGSMEFYPVPTSPDRVFVEYQSRFPVIQNKVGGWDSAQWDVDVWDQLNPTATPADRFRYDEDTFRLDDQILGLGVKWRILRSRGMPYDEEYAEYENAAEIAKGNDHGGPRSFDLSGGCDSRSGVVAHLIGGGTILG